MNMLKFNKLSYSYNDKKVFNNFNLVLSNNKSYSIIGPSSCGKTTLAKIMCGKIKDFQGEVLLNNYDISGFKSNEINKIILSIFDDGIYLKGTLREEIMFVLERNGYDHKNINKTTDYIIDYFEAEAFSTIPVKKLTISEKVMAKIILSVASTPMVIVIDDLFKWVSLDFKKKVISFLEDQNILLINIVSNMEDVMLTDYLIVMMKNGNVAIEGKTMSVLQEEKLLKRLGFNLPFMVDLSIQLKCYELIDDIYLDKKEMIKNIWK